MKVKELIKRLKKTPRNAEVYIEPYPVTAEDAVITMSQVITPAGAKWLVYIQPKTADETETIKL